MNSKDDCGTEALCRNCFPAQQGTNRTTVIDKNLEDIPPGEYRDTTFFNCTFRHLNGVSLRNCDLNRSHFLSEDVRDVLDFTVTLNCHSFDNVELSPLIFDLILCLLLKSKGNTEKRRKLIDVIGKERVAELLRQLQYLEL